MTEAETERAKVVAWLESEADESRALLLKNPHTEMAHLYGTRALYYQQAAGFIRRGEHTRDHLTGETED